MAKRKKNEIWITRTSAGYCTKIRDNLNGSSNYLNDSDSSQRWDSTIAAYLSFPKTMVALAQIDHSFYSHGIKLKFDKHRQERIPEEESAAITCVVRSLEDLAVLAAERRSKIWDAIEALQRE